jgi:prefoldin subunit 5
MQFKYAWHLLSYMDPDEAQLRMDHKELRRIIAQLEENNAATAKKIASLDAEISGFERQGFIPAHSSGSRVLEVKSALKFYSDRLGDIKRAIDNNKKELARLETKLGINRS